MASWGSFAWGFFIGLTIGQVTLGFFLALVRQGRAFENVESPALADGHETPARRGSIPVEAT